MGITLFVIVAGLFLFLLGVLVGSGQVTRAQNARDRRQAATQRDLSLQFRLLHEQQKAAKEEMRGLSKQQAGLVVINYDATSTHPRRSA